MRRNSPESLPWRHECLGRGGEGVTDPEQLGGDAEGDFVGVVGADGFADGAKEVFGAFDDGSIPPAVRIGWWRMQHLRRD